MSDEKERIEKLRADLRNETLLESKLRIVFEAIRSRQVEIGKGKYRPAYIEELLDDVFFDQCMELLRPLVDKAQMDAASRGTSTSESRIASTIISFLSELPKKPLSESQAEMEKDKRVNKEQGPIKNLSTAQRVWAFHYLLTESGLSYANVDKTEIARFITALTGEGYDNVYRRVLNKAQTSEKATQKDLAVIRSWFERLGMLHIVKKIDQESDIG